jgi:hypothetical protein
VLFNIYLHRLDVAMERIGGGFYARYSDDVVFAHPDVAHAKHAARVIDAVLAERCLRLNPDKQRTYYLTAAGRSAPSWSTARGTTSVPVLGTTVSADGTVGLSHKKVRRLLREVETCAASTAAATRGPDVDRTGRLVCAVVNRVLDPQTQPFKQASSDLLRRAVTDRRQLQQLDHQLARIVLRAVTGDGGVRAFRRTPVRKIREDWGLVSLVRLRNAYGR